MEFQNSHFTNLTATTDYETAIYKALWHACAGPLATVPRPGERVFYFPQAHLEHPVRFQEAFDLLESVTSPFHFLGLFLAEPDTDQVFAQVALLPESNQDENTVEMEPPLPPLPEFLVHSFYKTLTPSDTSFYAGLSVLKRLADQCFPPLDMSRQPPNQELVARDLHGNEWRFQHVFKGQPRKHLLTSGWRDFVSSKRPVVGDAFVFLRGENGQLRVGLRRAMRPQGNVSFSTSSSTVMFPEMLETAWDAYTKRTIFITCYKPRTSPAEFIVPFDRYMESMRNNY
ncbi:hypothetical protein REPUB_Repub10bG0040600 [Reevesia pubescens]